MPKFISASILLGSVKSFSVCFFVCLFVCLFVCGTIFFKVFRQISMKLQDMIEDHQSKSKFEVQEFRSKVKVQGHTKGQKHLLPHIFAPRKDTG